MQREGKKMWQMPGGHCKESKGSFIVIFPALTSAVEEQNVSLGTHFVLPIDPKGFSLPPPNSDHLILNFSGSLFYKRVTS